MSSIASLLNSVSSIIKSYEKVAAITGENFNVFSILKMDSNEVRLHSALIGELLNPKGSHGQKDVFLKLFLKEINSTDFDTENATVEVEKHIGLVTDEGGGRIDLIISSQNNTSIIIENKIYAGDGYRQLLRYHKYNTKAKLFYLTLDGDKPSKASLGYLKPDLVKQISYRFHIINWLEECKKQAVNFPLLRETITQYIYLLKHLTNQSINHEMDNEILKTVLKDADTVNAAMKIVDNRLNIKKALIEKLFHDIQTRIGIETVIDGRIGSNDNYFHYVKKNWSYRISLFIPSNMDYLKIGVLDLAGNPKEKRFDDKVMVDKIRTSLSDLIIQDDLSIKWQWVWLTSCIYYDNASWGECADGRLADKMANYIKEMIVRLEKIEGFTKDNFID